VADDIAYSTYDLEDAFKADFLNPALLLSRPPVFPDEIASEVSGRIEQHYPDLPKSQKRFEGADVFLVLYQVFGGICGASSHH
jgi:dGTPase